MGIQASDVRNSLSNAGWVLPDQANIEDTQIQDWFETHERISKDHANSHAEVSEELGQATAWTALGTVALGIFAPPLLIPGALGIAYFGTGAIQQSSKKSDFLNQHQVVKQTKKIWIECKKDVVYLEHLKQDIQAQRLQLERASAATLPQVLKNTQKKWDAFQTTVNAQNPFKRFTKGLRKRGESIVTLIKEFDTVIKAKTLTQAKIYEKKEEMLNLFQNCIQQNGKIDKLIQSRERSADDALYEAVKAREKDTLELREHGGWIDGIPTLVTNGNGAVCQI